MSDDGGVESRFNHRHFVCIVIALAEGYWGEGNSLFHDLGYTEYLLELDVSTSSQPHQVDVYLQNPVSHRSLLAEVKSDSAYVKGDQLRRYLSVTLSELVRSGVTVQEPNEHIVSVLYFVALGAEQEVARVFRELNLASVPDWGVITLGEGLLRLAHDELSDNSISERIGSGLLFDTSVIPLDRIPFESSSPDWEVGDRVFQAIVSLFASEVDEFTIDDVCLRAHPLFSKFPTKQSDIKRRVGKHVRKIVKVALEKWVQTAGTRPADSDRWMFFRGNTDNLQTIRALNARHRRYVEILTNEPNRNVRKSDFQNLIVDQPSFPLEVTSSSFFPLDPKFEAE